MKAVMDINVHFTIPSDWYPRGIESLKGVLSKNLQNPYICGRGGITAGVTVHTMLTHLVQLRLRAIVRGNR